MRIKKFQRVLLIFDIFLFGRCHDGSSRGECSTGAEVAGTAQVPTISSSPSSSSSNTDSSSRRLSTFHRLDRQFHLQPRRRNITPFLLRPRPHGTMIFEKSYVRHYVLEITLAKREVLNPLKGKDGVLATRSGDVCGASRARRTHERYRGCDGPARWTWPSACGTSACGASPFNPRRGRGRTVLCAERCNDVLVARLRWHRFSTCITLWFVLYMRFFI